MNIKERIEIVKAMDLLCRQINDEEVFMTWLIYGVADGDVEIGDDERLECYVDDDAIEETTVIWICDAPTVRIIGNAIEEDIIIQHNA